MYNPINKTTCYEDDISGLLWQKSLDDVTSWMYHTNRMIERLTMNPDPTKGDPQVLIKKLAGRVKQMKKHIKKRASETTDGWTIGPPKLRVKMKQNTSSLPARLPTSQLSMRPEKPLPPKVFNRGDYMPTPPCTLDEAIERDGEIIVENDPLLDIKKE